MLTEREIEVFGFGHEAIFKDLEKAIMSDIVRRIRQTDVITRSADFQLNHLKMLGMSDYEIKKMAEQYIQASDDYLDRVFANAIETDYIDNKELYKAQGKEFIPFEDNEMIQQWIQAIKLQTKDEMRRLTESMGFVVQTGSRKVVQPVGVFYQNVLDQSVVDIMMGTFDYNRVLNDAVRKMTHSGLRWIDYQSGWHNRVTVAARRAVMTGISQITMQISEMNANELGTDYFEVTAHANARPSHAEWQGKVYSRKELETVCHLGEVTGLLGANCYHMYYPFIPGVSKRAYTDNQLDEWKSDKPIEYNGKEYNGYEATQRMRQMETNMRAQREKIYLLKQGEANRYDLLNEQAYYRGQMAEYAKFADRMGLKQQKERISADGLGKLVNASWKNNLGMTKERKDAIFESEIKRILHKPNSVVHLQKTPIDCDELSIDIIHINKERNHNVTESEAKSFIDNAYFSVSVWDSRFERYYSKLGATYVDMEGKEIRTAFKAKEFDDITKSLIKEYEQYDKSK
jgi:hypothetical protein